MATQQTFAFLDTDLVHVAERPAARSCAAITPPVCSPKTPAPKTECSAVATGADHEQASERQEPEHQKLGRETILRQLRKSIGCVSTSSSDTTRRISTGSAAIDRWLPQGGLRADALTEWVADDSCGAATLAMIAAATHLRSDTVAGPLVIVDGEGTFYPPAAISLGVSVERIILVRPRRHADVVWSIDQALRCESVAAVWAHVSSRLDDRDARRFQLAAETGCTPGLLIRPASVRGRPSFADVRFHVEKGGRTQWRLICNGMSPATGLSRNDSTSRPGAFALPLNEKGGPCRQKCPDPFFASGRLLHVTLDRCRGGTIGRNAWLQIDDQARIHEVAVETAGNQTTGPQTADTVPSVYSTESIDHEKASALHLASELAHPTSAKSASQRRA